MKQRIWISALLISSIFFWMQMWFPDMSRRPKYVNILAIGAFLSFGELTEKCALENRIQILKAAQAKLKDFISSCESMELMLKDESEFSAKNGAINVADQRAKKIARFKRQKTAETKLLQIMERKERRLRSTNAAATPVVIGENEALDDDGEEEREGYAFWNILLLEDGVQKLFGGI